jgi:hypothetical protein
LAAANPLKSRTEEFREYELLIFCLKVIRLVTGLIDLPNPRFASEPKFSDGTRSSFDFSKSTSVD